MTPGLLVLHGNRLELLGQTLAEWLARHPLQALEQEVLLVPSNGMAEWLKMQLAQQHGIFAGMRVELPARFLWHSYRAVLGRAEVPPVAALDGPSLAWRLMGLLDTLPPDAPFAPLRAALHGDDANRQALPRWQLAQQLASLFDQYQVYRPDWLDDWASERLQLRRLQATPMPLPAEQHWQALLWQRLLRAVPDPNATRPRLQQRFVQALQGALPAGRLPRRVVLFGTTQLPHAFLEALAAIARHTQVLVAVPNPCRYHWADLLDGRELLPATPRRQPLRAALDASVLSMSQLQQQGHPLLTRWGRQARDFIRQLDAFDEAQAARAALRSQAEHSGLRALDLFDDSPPNHWLGQLQAAVRDLVPLHELQATPPAADDRSIQFHIAHSAQRELEVLHDQLLLLLAQTPAVGQAPLAPRDIVVMVPDIEAFAPAIRSVFGAFDRNDARHIPWGLADQRLRGSQPLLRAVEWLLQLPSQRAGFSELQALLDVPAIAARFGLADEAERELLLAWLAQAGLRWGLHEAQRAQLGLAECGAVNTWDFALQRLLLGYATGPLAQGHAGIEPLAEVGGLSAATLGGAAELLAWLSAWWQDALLAHPLGGETGWAERLRRLLAEGFAAQDDAERELLAELDAALSQLLQASHHASMDSQPLPLTVLREAWLDGLNLPNLRQRFRAGGVTFCTLLPLRAVPFEVVCLLGMNEGDFPRRSGQHDFDLMALPGLARAGDRARRHDDRQLMLDALLSARRLLYVSWAGRSQREPLAQPPSVLVAQLRDHLAAGWGEEALAAATTEHPLQPFSRRYFEADSPLHSFVNEWRDAHATAQPLALPPVPAASEPLQLDLSMLERFLRNPVKTFFEQRLRVRLTQHGDGHSDADPPDDDERFALDGLDAWTLRQALLEPLLRPDSTDSLDSSLARLQRAGQLPLAAPGRHAAAQLREQVGPLITAYRAACARLPELAAPLQLEAVVDAGLCLRDQLDPLRCHSSGDAPTQTRWLASRLTLGKPSRKTPPALRAERLLLPYLSLLAAQAQGQPLQIALTGLDAQLHLAAPAQDAVSAQLQLQQLLGAAREGLQGNRPLPAALRTGLTWLEDGNAALVFDGSGFSGNGFDGQRAEGHEASLARCFPRFADLAAAPGFENTQQRLYGDFAAWLGSKAVQIALHAQADAEAADASD